MHDQCLTSEVLGSMRCDCKQQLEMAMDYISQHGGCVIYLQQVLFALFNLTILHHGSSVCGHHRIFIGLTDLL